MYVVRKQVDASPKWHRYSQFLLGLLVGAVVIGLWGPKIGACVILVLCLFSVIWGKTGDL